MIKVSSHFEIFINIIFGLSYIIIPLVSNEYLQIYKKRNILHYNEDDSRCCIIFNHYVLVHYHHSSLF